MMEKFKKHANKIYVGIFLVFIIATLALFVFGKGEMIAMKIVSDDSEIVATENLEDIKELEMNLVPIKSVEEDLVPIEDRYANLVPIADVEHPEAHVQAIAVRTYEDGQVYNYNVQEIREPELILANVKDVTKNSYYTAKLNRLSDNEEYSEIEVLTDMPINNVYYTIVDKDTGLELYRGNLGLVIHQTKNYCNIKAYKNVFGYDNFRPEWAEEEITYYMQSGKDSSIKITPNFDTSKRFATIKPVPKPGA